MDTQMRHIEDVENILWGTQATQQAHLPKPGALSGEYEQSWQAGFDQALVEAKQVFEYLKPSKKIWLRRDVRRILLNMRWNLESTSLITGKVQPMEKNQGFTRGHETALWCMATSMGTTLLTSQQYSMDNFSSRYPTANQWFLTEDIINILFALKTTALLITVATKSVPESSYFYEGFEAGLQYIAQLFNSPPYRWLQHDIERKLKSISVTPKSTIYSLTDSQLMAYQQGFATALQIIATSFGIRNLAIVPVLETPPKTQ